MSEQAPIISAGAVTRPNLDPAAQAELQNALAMLDDGGGLLVRLADLMGNLMGRGVRMGVRGLGVAPSFQAAFQGIAEAALRRAFDVAILGLPSGAFDRPRRRMARPIVMLSGAMGGFAGLPGLAPDVTVTTIAILRQIARIAQEEGENLADPEARRACLQIFALRAEHANMTGSELGYFSARLALQGRPLVLLLNEVAASYGFTLSQKLTLQAVPVVGALAGAALNRAFLIYYEEAARAHFIIRRLERRYGQDTIQRAAVLVRVPESNFTSGTGST